MRSLWKGSISFGLVNVPVKLYSATEDHDVSLHQVHDKDGGRIRYERRCQVCGEVVDYDHINRAYEEGGKTVVLTDADLDSLPEGHSREIEVVEFVPPEQINPLRFGKSYYLEPDSRSIKSYVLMRRTLEDTDRMAIVKFALRNKTRLGALMACGQVLTIQGLLWDDEVREANFGSLDQDVHISAKELKLSASLVKSMEDDFEPAQYSDDYQEQLKTLIESKLDDAVDTEATFGDSETESGDENVIDLMEALRRSVAKNKGRPPARKQAASKAGTDTSSPKKRPKAKKSKQATQRPPAKASGAKANKAGKSA